MTTESVKQTIKDHPTETVAAVAVVALFAVFVTYKRKNTKLKNKARHCVCPPAPTWWNRMFGYRKCTPTALAA